MKESNFNEMNDRLITNLRDLSHTMRFLYEGKGSQKRILILLDELGGNTTQRKLTEQLGIQPGSASEVIAKLENAGYISRMPNELDRRTVDITLTDTGKTLAAETKEQRNNRHEQMFSCLTAEEKLQLLSLLEKVNDDWKERYQDARDCHEHGRHHHGYSNHHHGHSNHHHGHEDHNHGHSDHHNGHEDRHPEHEYRKDMPLPRGEE